MSKRKHNDNAFMDQAVKLALEIGQSKACNALNLPENTLYGRMHTYRLGMLGLTTDRQTPAWALTMNEGLIEHLKQVKALPKENKRLSVENTFLEEASVFSLRTVGSWQRREEGICRVSLTFI